MDETERATKQLCDSHRHGSGRFLTARRVVLVVFWLTALLFYLGLSFRVIPASLIEDVHMARVVPVLRAVLGGIAGVFPFSLAELLLVVYLLLGAAAVFEVVARAWRRRWAHAPMLRRFLVWSLVGLWLYLLGHGAGLAREPLGDRLDLPRPLAEERVALHDEVGLAVAAAAREAREKLPSAPAPSFFDMGRRARAAIIAVLPDLRCGVTLPPGNVKPCFPKYLQMRFSVSGAFSPFTFEAHADPGLHDLELPFVLAHELAHVAGFASEDEANFVAWLACSRSRDPRLRYAAALAALRFFRTNDDLREAAGPLVARDRAAIAEHWRAKRWGATSRVQHVVWDVVLKSHGVEKGIASYGEMVELMIRWRLRYAR